MVVKPGRQRQVLHSRFESRVILDGSQTDEAAQSELDSV